MTSRGRALLVRIGIAIAVIGALVWWFEFRDNKTPGTRPLAGASERPERTGGGGGGGGGGRHGGGRGDRIVTVQLAPVVREDVPIWIEGLGTVTAFQQVTVRSQVDGRLDKVMFAEGQAVKEGEVLAQIDPRPFLVQLHQAQGALARDKAQLAIAKRNYDRYQGLQDQKLVAQQQVDEYAAQVGQYEGAVTIDRAAVEQAQLQLDYAKVKAPLSGIVGVRLVDAGNLVKASDQTGLVVITQVDPAAVMFTVPQDRLPDVSAALARDDVRIEIWNRDGTERLAEGTRAVLDNQVNQSTATLRLKAIVPNPKRALWPNAFVKARMLVDTRPNALVIPAVAIQRGPQGTFVYTVGDDHTAKLSPIEVVAIAGDRAIVKSGVEPSQQVVIEGQSQLRPGGKVAPIGAHGEGSAEGPGPTASKR